MPKALKSLTAGRSGGSMASTEGVAMRAWLQHICALSGALAAAAAASLPAAAADPIADFYSGKTVQVLIGFSPGGGYDIYGRTLARYMGRHIPGNPKLVPQNMPGAGSLKVVNYLSSVAPKDGTAIAHFAPGVMFEPLLGHTDGAQFEATKFNWLGSASREASVCAFMTSAGIKSWQDMRTKSYIIGASGGGAESDVFPTVLRNMFHLPLKIVTGYPGGTEITWRWSATRSTAAAAGRGPACSAAARRCSIPSRSTWCCRSRCRKPRTCPTSR